MFITKKHIPRRTFLRGAGVTLALPFLESMVPAFTGLAPQTAAVAIGPGQGITKDFSLTRGDARSAGEEALVLDAFTVAAGKEMSGRELALNEQRFAANLKNVVAAALADC